MYSRVLARGLRSLRGVDGVATVVGGRITGTERKKLGVGIERLDYKEKKKKRRARFAGEYRREWMEVSWCTSKNCSLVLASVPCPTVWREVGADPGTYMSAVEANLTHLPHSSSLLALATGHPQKSSPTEEISDGQGDLRLRYEEERSIEKKHLSLADFFSTMDFLKFAREMSKVKNETKQASYFSFDEVGRWTIFSFFSHTFLSNFCLFCLSKFDHFLSFKELLLASVSYITIFFHTRYHNFTNSSSSDNCVSSINRTYRSKDFPVMSSNDDHRQQFYWLACTF